MQIPNALNIYNVVTTDIIITQALLVSLNAKGNVVFH